MSLRNLYLDTTLLRYMYCQFTLNTAIFLFGLTKKALKCVYPDQLASKIGIHNVLTVCQFMLIAGMLIAL